MGWIRRSTRRAAGRAGGNLRVQGVPSAVRPLHSLGAQGPGERRLRALPRPPSPRRAQAQRRGERAPGAREARGGGLCVHKENGLHAPLP